MTISKKELKKLILAYLAQNRLMTLATAKNNLPWATTVFFAYDQNLNLYFISEPATRKIKNILANSRVAVTIDREQPGSGKIRGVQLEGRAEKLDKKKDLAELKIFEDRFNWTERYLASHELFQITPKRVYYLDDERSGPQGRETLEL